MRIGFRRSLGLRWAATALLVIGLLAGGALQALANLPGSTFEGNDGNLIVNTAGNTDWVNAPHRVRGDDLASGTTDNSFGQGTKEDDPNVVVVTGSIPPQKSDLTRFYVASEFASNSNFLYLAWERSNVLGSANMDFEINQNQQPNLTTTGPKTLNRTAGDLLITFDFGGSGSPVLGLLTWVTTGATSQCFAANALPCWGNRVNLSAAGFADGAVNAVTVTDPIPPNAPVTLAAGKFGEAAVNLTAAGVFPPGTCRGFGSAFLKSRSSASFPAEVKDFIAPQPVSISNCGFINIIKHTDPRGINQDFGYTSTIPASATCSQDLTPDSFTLNDSAGVDPTPPITAGTANTEHCSSVPAGTYTVTEGADPANFAFESLVCTAEHGVSFTVNGVTKQTDANGVACFDGLPFGTYTVHETVPAGYHVDGNDKSVTVDNTATCSDSPYVGETVSFHNTPLTDITASVNSQVDGGTSSTIVCTDSNGNIVASGSTGANGDCSATAPDLEPGTYTCTVVIDP